MTFLPIATRELRVAARKRNTFWLRVIAALVGLVIGVAFMLIVTLNGLPTASFGPILFGTLTWLSLAAALTAGIFFTSDCLSEEKREGTLGFLFLTDLRGYDVVFGKLLATSLRGLFALLAIFPILAITMIMGGVTGVHFWKTALALLNALLCSLAVGLFVSAVSHDSQKAMGATFFWLFLIIAAGPIADAIIAGVRKVGFAPYFSITSPGYLFASAGAWGRNLYWMTLLVTQGITWFLFALASVLLPRTWQQKGGKTNVTRGWVYAWKYGGPRRRARIRRKLLSRDAVVWLACRERWQSLSIWLVALIGIATFIAVAIGLPGEVWSAWQFIRILFLFGFYLWASSQACRFFVEARRSGLTELLLAAPLSEGQIVRGHWRALLRMYGWPVLILVCLTLAGAALATTSWGRMTRAAATRTVSTSTTTNNINGTNVVTTTLVSNGVITVTTINGTNTSTQTIRQPFAGTPSSLAAAMLPIVSAVASGVTLAANLVAICWFGMWMGVISKNANFATLKTLLFVQIIPVMVIYFSAQILGALFFIPMLTRASSGGNSLGWMLFPLITSLTVCLLSVGKDIFFIAWSRSRLYGSFREQASRSFDQPRGMLAQDVAPPIAAPPLTA